MIAAGKQERPHRDRMAGAGHHHRLGIRQQPVRQLEAALEHVDRGLDVPGRQDLEVETGAENLVVSRDHDGAGVVAVGDSTNVFQLPARTFSVGPALSLPIFDGGRLRAKLAASDSVYDESVARYNSLLVAAINDVSDQVSALTSVRKQIELEKRAQDDARKSWEQAIAGYKGGVSGPLAPLISRQQLLLADQRTAALESQQADISIRLIEALGGGYVVEPSATANHTMADPTSR